MASAQAFMTYWMLRLLVKPQIARRWGSQSLDEQPASIKPIVIGSTWAPGTNLPQRWAVRS
jgi:hypothetical protein